MTQAGKRIRKIQWGLIPTLPTKIISNGSTVKFREPKSGIVEYFVSEITEDNDALYETGSPQFNIYVSKTRDNKNQLLWQRFSLRPDAIEYEFNEGEEEFIV